MSSSKKRGQLLMASKWDKYRVNIDSGSSSKWSQYAVPEEGEQPQQQEQQQPRQQSPLQGWASQLQKHPGLKAFLGATDKALEPIAKNVAQPIVNAFESAGYPQAVGGAIQGLGNTLSSVYNVAANPFSEATGVNVKAPKLDLRNNYPDNIGSDIGFYSGDLAGGLAGAGGAFKAISALSKTKNAGKVAETLKDISPEILTKIFSKISPDILKGAASGAAVSEDMPGGRALGGAVGAVGGAAANLAPKIAKFVKTPSAEKFSENFLNKVSNLKEGFGNRYDKIINFAENNKIKLNMKPSEFSGLEKDIGRITAKERKSQLEAVQDFIKNPTIKNAHQAQSELGLMERNFKKAQEKQGTLTTAKNRTWDSINRARETLKNSIDTSLTKSGYPEVSDKYLNLTNEYGKELGPYLDSPAFRKLESGNIFGKDFANKISKESKFMNAKGSEHPDIESVLKKEEIMKDLSKYLWRATAGTVGAAGLGYGAKKGYDALTD